MSARRSRSAQVWHSISASIPYALTAAALIAAIWGYLALHHLFPEASVLQKLYSTLAMFAGGYISLGSQYGTAPPTSLTIPSIVAFGVTIAAATSIVVTMSTHARNALRSWRARPKLTVIGSGQAAAAIVRSAMENDMGALLVTETADSEAARATQGLVPVTVVPSIDGCIESRLVRRIVARSDNVVVATDSASLNLGVRASIKLHRSEVKDGQRSSSDEQALVPDDFRSLIAVVPDPRLADAMRPAWLIGTLPEEDVTCPSENVAEHICHLIDGAATGSAAMTRDPSSGRIAPLVDRVAVEIVSVATTTYDDSDWSQLPETLELWIKRLAWGRSFVRGDEVQPGEVNPIVPIVLKSSENFAGSELLIRIYAGSPSRTVVAALDDQVLDDLGPACLTILVADTAIVQAAHDSFGDVRVVESKTWLGEGATLPAIGSGHGRTIFVDPVATGLDANLVVDAITMQWARMFDQTYQFMFASGSYPIIPWEPGSPLGDSVFQEETQAVRSALEKLAETRAAQSREVTQTERQDVVNAALWTARKRISDKYSSKRAATNMLKFLSEENPVFDLVRYDAAADQPPLPPDLEVVKTVIAGKEHEDWKVREWRDRSRRTRASRRALGTTGGYVSETSSWTCSAFSSSSANNYTFKALTDSPDPKHNKAARYNERIVTETYPAIAAGFGYRITPSVWSRYDRVGVVRATRQNQNWTWTTQSGEIMNALAGDWLVTDDEQSERSVAADVFGSMYEQESGDQYRRKGTVLARPARPHEVIETREGRATAGDGAWVVQGDAGERWPVSAEHFQRGYALRPFPRGSSNCGSGGG